MAPALMRKESTYGVSIIQRDHPVHHHRAHYQGRNGAASALVCQRHDLIGILSSAPSQVSLIFVLFKYQILVLFYGSFNYCNPTPFVRLILGSLEQVMYTVRDICWRACLGSQDRVLAVAKKQNSQL